MDNFVDDRDYKLLESDKLKFAVLRKIIADECKVLLSDHEKIILCFSKHPYPAWIWTADNLSNNEKEDFYKIIIEALPFKDNYLYVMKSDFANYFINRAKDDNKKLTVKKNMFAYECVTPIKPKNISDGFLYKCTMQDVDELVELIDLFRKEINSDIATLEEYRQNAIDGIKNERFFFLEK